MEDSHTQQVVPHKEEHNEYIKGVVEALLFVNERPVTVEQLRKVIGSLNSNEIKKVLQSLQEDYEQRKSGMTILEIAGGYQMLSNPYYVSFIRNFYKTKHKEKLSKPALESLAIVAYKQPVTRSDIEIIRGVNSDGVVTHLVEKELIKIIGRKDVPGRPYLYGTTKQFMEYFGLRSLDDLPKLEEFPNLQPVGEQREGPAELQPPGADQEASSEENSEKPVEENSPEQKAQPPEQNEENVAELKTSEESMAPQPDKTEEAQEINEITEIKEIKEIKEQQSEPQNPESPEVMKGESAQTQEAPSLEVSGQDADSPEETGKDKV